MRRRGDHNRAFNRDLLTAISLFLVVLLILWLA